VPYPPLFDALAAKLVRRRLILLGLSLALVTSFFFARSFPPSVEIVWLKLTFVGVVWCWGLVLAATWFGPGGPLRAAADLSIGKRGARIYGASALTFVLLGSLLVFPFG